MPGGSRGPLSPAGGAVPQGTVTFLFTDLEGSTRLWQEVPEQMATALAFHDQLFRELTNKHEGHLFSVAGDSFGVAFATPDAAIAVAEAFRSGLETQPLLSIRMGIHTGVTDTRDNNYFGTEVNRAARIMSAGHGGQIVVSAATAALVPHVPMTSLGSHRLRDLEGTTTLAQLGTATFPPPRSVDNLIGNIPVRRTSFIGREDEAKLVASAIAAAQLVTLVGPGGVGKSRLSVHIAAEHEPDFSGGAWMAELARVNDDDLVATALVDAVSVRGRLGEPAIDTLERWFQATPVLLVIDNCEHVMDGVVSVVDRLLSRPSSSRILTTSQSPLTVSGERVFSVGPLKTKNGTESMRLFADRAAAVRSGFLITDDNEGSIASICDQLDHIPLAIELAASRIRAMSPGDIAKRLDQRFRLLSSGDRSGPERHRTLDQAVRWSYELLDPVHQTVLQRLAVFVAPFTLDQAENVAAGEDVDQWAVFDALIRLVDRSLVVAIDQPDNTTRYHLLQSIKAFARRELEASDQLGTTQNRYTKTFQELILREGNELIGANTDDQAAFARIETDWEHVRVAMEAARSDRTTTDFDRCYAALAPMWNARGRTSEGTLWGAELLDRPIIDAQLRINALGPAAGTANLESTGTGDVYSDAADSIAEEHNTLPPVSCLASRLLHQMLAGEHEQATQGAVDLVQILDSIPHSAMPVNDWSRTNALSQILAVLAIAEDDLTQFKQVFPSALKTAEEHCSASVQATMRSASSAVAHKIAPDNTIEYLKETLTAVEAVGNFPAAAANAMFLAIAHMKNGDMQEAARIEIRAIDLALNLAPTYLGLQFGISTAILMGSNPSLAAELLSGARAFRQRRELPGTSQEMAAEGFYELVLTEKLSTKDYSAAKQRGDQCSEDELARLAQEALADIGAG